MGAGQPKQYLPLAGRPLIHHALSTLCAVPAIARVVVVLAPDDAEWDRPGVRFEHPKLRVLRCGGATRAESVASGLRALPREVSQDDWVLVHDAARPCLTVALVEKLIREVGEGGEREVGGILAVPVADTLKRSASDGRIEATVPREGLWQAQTPQMFRQGLLLKALDAAAAASTLVTDEASAVEALGLRPRLVAADPGNLKVTYPFDLQLAEWILSNRRADA